MKPIHHLPLNAPPEPEFPPLGEDPVIHPTAHITDTQCGRYVEIGAFAELKDCVIGDYSYVAGSHTSLTNCDIGNFTSIASHVRVNPANHPVDRPTQHHCTYRRRQYGFDTRDDTELFAWRKAHRCTIGHDVWLGHGATIMPGVNVGTGAVVGSGAVITKDVEPYTIVAGVPARPLRKRFDDATIDKLLATEWWTWSHEKLKAEFPRLLSLDAMFGSPPFTS
ncbi:MAG: DapH/DapD/GlmU-related protein [Kiritimatiellia bacterium]